MRQFEALTFLSVIIIVRVLTMRLNSHEPAQRPQLAEAQPAL